MAADLEGDPRAALLKVYAELRTDLSDLEAVLGNGGLDEKTAKRLDKAATLLKVGAKLAKKALLERKAREAPSLRRVV